MEHEVILAIKWVKLKRYCQLSGDTACAVHAKRRKGAWLDGVHCKVGPDGNLWVNILEVESWVEKGDIATLNRARQA